MKFGNDYDRPVKQGDEIEITIESTGAKGDGVAKLDNFVIIVPGAKEGDRVRVRITRVLRKMAFGDIIGDGEEGQAEEASAEEAQAEEPAEETPAEEPTEETPAEEPTEETPAEEPTEETPAEEPAEEKAPAEEETSEEA